METPRRVDPEIQIRRDFEREDREDSRSLRWSMIAALIVHALLLTLALPAAERGDEWQVTACSIPLKSTYARPQVPRTAPLNVQKPALTKICNLTPPQEVEPEPLLKEDPDLDFEPQPTDESAPWSRSLGVTPQLTACVEPQWTEIARKARIQGSVILEVTIREDGAVADPKVLKPLPFGLDEAALEAVAEWRYEPIQVDGEPAAVRHHVVVKYEIGEFNCPEEIRVLPAAMKPPATATLPADETGRMKTS